MLNEFSSKVSTFILVFTIYNKFKRFINMSKLSKTEIGDFDKWIEQLKECQPLEECQVKILCEKVKYKN